MCSASRVCFKYTPKWATKKGDCALQRLGSGWLKAQEEKGREGGHIGKGEEEMQFVVGVESKFNCTEFENPFGLTFAEVPGSVTQSR
ncbi:hypothetical protein NDU88_001628 [Pleurodeles waltl]|uniref:Uncharacterized protein n=1 Tax=Pleurodeles waltl TaxID=8319 RepID=A0AAV7V8B8_PLEWA|nr:hypothetical protein NDU88_001628 [Pleurodeles waltl]